MKKIKKISRLSLLALLASCNLKAPTPPDWSEDCSVSDDTYIRLAEDDSHRPPRIPQGTTPEDSIEESERGLKSIGYEVMVGNPPGQDGLLESKKMCAITLPGGVYISKECNDRVSDKPIEKAALLRHEHVHAIQQNAMGASFFLMYSFAEGRLLGIESPAYRESIYTRKFFGDDISKDAVYDFAGKTYDKYDGVHMPRHCYQQIASEVWFE